MACTSVDQTRLKMGFWTFEAQLKFRTSEDQMSKYFPGTSVAHLEAALYVPIIPMFSYNHSPQNQPL